jgi:hypothetical protein
LDKEEGADIEKNVSGFKEFIGKNFKEGVRKQISGVTLNEYVLLMKQANGKHDWLALFSKRPGST